MGRILVAAGAGVHADALALILTRQLARMAVLERDDDPVGGDVVEPVQRICGKARLCLLAIGNNGRAGFLKSSDRVAERLKIDGVQFLLSDPSGSKPL